MLNFDQILVFVVILFILISLYKEILGPSFTFMIGVSILGVFGVITPSQILHGFANEQIAVIILLLLLGEIIRKTAVVEILFDKMFRNAKNYRGFMSRMMIIISGFSAFLNNTPLVAVMMPYVNSWCKRNDISPSKFLMPLSFAAILGGCATLIGTSTNLIVNGLVVDNNIIPGLPSLGIFDFVWVGVPMIVIGFFYLLFFGEKLLPDRGNFLDSSTEQTRLFQVEAEIRPNSRLINTCISDSGVLDYKGLFILEIRRGLRKITAVSVDMILKSGDIVILAGDTDVITEILESDSGLTLPTGMMKKKKRTELVEIVVSHNSGLIGRKVKHINFRSQYDGAVIAIHRNGERIKSKFRELPVKAGDVLLLFTGEDFISRAKETMDFYFISKVSDFQRFEWWKIGIVLGGTVLAILLAALELMPLFMSLLVLVLITLAIKVADPKDLPRSIDYDLALIIVMALALGTAMIQSKAANLIADMIISVFIPMGSIGLLFGIYMITAVLAAYITNKAAVAIIFPISLTMAKNLDLPYQPFILIVAFAAAANFITPIGYQTNLMVYGPGGYNFKDFFKVGFPLTIIYMLVTVGILSLMYF